MEKRIYNIFSDNLANAVEIGILLQSLNFTFTRTLYKNSATGKDMLQFSIIYESLDDVTDHLEPIKLDYGL